MKAATSTERLRTRLVLALLAGPFAAALDMVVSYVLVYRIPTRGKLPLHVATVIALGVASAGIAYALRVRRDEAAREDHFLAALAAALGVFFAVVILAFELPTVLLRATD